MARSACSGLLNITVKPGVTAMRRLFWRVIRPGALLPLAALAATATAADIDTLSLSSGDLLVVSGSTQRLTATGFFNDATNSRLSNGTVAAGFNHSCVLIANGEVRCWGRNGSGQLGNLSTADSSQPVSANLFSTIVWIQDSVPASSTPRVMSRPA